MNAEVFCQMASREEGDFVMQVIPPAGPSAPDLAQRISLMQNLVLSEQAPVALEIAGTHRERVLLVRATTATALDHVRRQLLMAYPQAKCVSLGRRDDPLHLAPHETVAACELRLGAAAFVPLRTWDGHGKPTLSPIGGLLAGLDGLPEGVRAICQVTLVPAPPTWSRAMQPAALARTLEAAQRKREREEHEARSAPSTATLIGGAIMLLAFLLYPRYQQVIPPWLGSALLHLAKGQVQAVPLIQRLLIYGIGLALFTVLIGARLLLRRVREHLGTAALYSRRRLEEHTAQMAYCVRLRLYVLGPDAPRLHLVPLRLRPLAHRRLLWHSFRRTPSGTGLMQTRGTSGARLLALMGQYGRGGRWVALRCWRRVARWLDTQTRSIRQWWRVRRALLIERKVLLQRLVAAYRQYHLAAGNYFVPHRLSTRHARRLLIAGTGWWQGMRTRGLLLTGEEITHLWHLPAGEHLSELPLVEQKQARSLLVPAALGQGNAQQPFVGISEHAGHQVPVHLPLDLFGAHLFLAGKTGEGKSSALVHLVRASMREHGVVVVDPHGDLIEQVLCLVPAERVEDVVLVDLADQDYAVGLNPLDVRLGRGRDKTVADLLAAFAQIWPASWGSRMESVFEYALRTLYEANAVLCQQDPIEGPERQYTLLDVVPLLTDESFCHALLEQIQQVDPYLVRWWYLYYDPLSTYMQRERIDPVLSKVARFESYLARRIVGQSHSTISIAECIQQEQIVLVKLARGVIGEEMAHLLGATLLSLVHQALSEQGEQALARRKRLLVVVDEFQFLTGVDWGALAELRKYGATFALATQSLQVLQARNAVLLSLVLSSTKQWIIFHLSAPDAHLVARELDVEPQDLVHLERYTSYVKWLSHEVRHPTFSLRWRLPPEGSEEIATRVREHSRRRLTTPAHLVDAHLAEAIIRAHSARPREEDSRQLEPEPSTKSIDQKDVTAQPARGGTGPSQAGKYRGRRAQEQRLRAHQSAKSLAHPMNWQETVGHVRDSKHLSGPTTHQQDLGGESQEESTHAREDNDAANAR